MIARAGMVLSLLAGLLGLRDKPPAPPMIRVIHVARARWLLRGYSAGRGVSVEGGLVLDVRGELRIRDRVSFVGKVLPTSITVHPGGGVIIGEETVFNYGASIESGSSVSIGRRCLFGSFVRIADRDKQGSGPVVIGDDVWIAHGAIIGPGVTIGCGSVVAAGSVVMNDVPPQSMAIGNPARMMSLSFWTGARDS